MKRRRGSNQGSAGCAGAAKGAARGVARRGRVRNAQVRGAAHSWGSRVLAAAVSLVLCVSMLPASALAEELQAGALPCAAPSASVEAANVLDSAGNQAESAPGASGAVPDGEEAAENAGAQGSGGAENESASTVAPDGAAGTAEAAGAAEAATPAEAAEEETTGSAYARGGDASNALAAATAEGKLAPLDTRTLALMERRDAGLAVLSNSYDYSGEAFCWFRNDSPTDDVFTVEIDGESYEAYCLDPGLPAPANGWYTFYATWDNSEKAYDIVLDTADAEVHWSQVDIGAGCQRVGGFRIYAKGSFTLSKTSSNVEVSGIYSVAGAVYGLYWYYADALASATPDYRLVIGSNGSSDTISGLTPDDNWYIRELEAPTGFTLDPNIYTVPIRPNQSNTYQVSDTPVMDPNGVLLHKVTADGQVYAGERPSLALAKYQFDYYAGYYDTVEQAQASGAPTRSWVLRTNENGYTGIRYADLSFTAHDGVTYPYLVSGKVYRAASGKPSMPLGTLVIHEVEAPFGYNVSSAYFLGQLKPADNDYGFEWDLDKNFFDGNTAIDEEQLDVGSLTVLKKSSDPDFTKETAGYSLAGARFDIYDNAECQGTPAYSLITKDDGTTDIIQNLAPGSHWFIKEALPPAGFAGSQEIYEAVIQPGSVATTTVEIENVPVYAPAAVSLVKKDSAGARGFKGEATLAGAEYTFEFYAGKTSVQGSPDGVWKGTTDANGRVSLADATLVAGKEWLVDGQRVLPLGALRVYESQEPQGYIRSEEQFEAALVYDDQTQTARWVQNGVAGASASFADAVEFEAPEDLKLFGISVFKTIQGVPNEVSPEGIQFEIVYRPTGNVVKTLTLGADGKASTGERALPCGVYEVREVDESVPAGILPYRETSGEGSNVIAVVDAKDDGDFPLYQVVETNCVDYTYDTPRGEKKDHETGAAIAGTEFTLYRCTERFPLEDGAIQADASTIDARADYWEPVQTVATDDHGKFNFDAQPYGVFMMVETNPEWHYLSASEGAFDGASADPRETARIFVIDKNHPCDVQLWEDTAIQVECTVDKSTIAVTSAGLVSKESSEAEASVSNVGSEEYRYDVAFSSGSTNTYADEFWVEDYLNMVAAPYDLRLTTIVLPSVVNDAVPAVNLLVKTNKSSGETWVPAVEAAVHASTLCDGSSRFDGTGWRFAGEYASEMPTSLKVADLGLAPDEYLTGLCLYYGAVEKGFASVRPLSYMVVATHELLEGVVIPNTAASHITRNWAQRLDTVNGLSDDDSDSVSTTVLGTFEQHFGRDYPHASSGHTGSVKTFLPQTGDVAANRLVAFSLVGVVALVALAFMLRARRFACNAKGKSSAMGKLWEKLGGMALVGLLVALPLGGCSCSRQDDASAASSASAAASASISRESADAAASAEAGAEEILAEASDDEAEASASEGYSRGSAASQAGGGASPSSPAGSSGPSSPGNPAQEPAASNPPAHEHSWEWVPNVVTIVDREGYDEPVYRWATWCPTCGCEVTDFHGEDMMLQGDGGHTLTDLQVLDYYIHHDAETHTEDHGYYQCSGCGATR